MVVTVPKTRIFRYNKYSRKIRDASRFYKSLAVPLRGPTGGPDRGIWLRGSMTSPLEGEALLAVPLRGPYEGPTGGAVMIFFYL